MAETYLERARAILAAEADAIPAVQLNATFDEAVEAMFSCADKIITTGMGKAGFVARKFAATLCSTGTPAVFVQPGEAAHGDLGVIARGDCIVASCRLGLTPTASVAVMASISHALTLVLMEKKSTTRRDYGLRHHGGYLGARARGDNEAPDEER